MKKHNSLKELLYDYNHKLLDRWTSGSKQDFTEFVEEYLSSNSLALGKPEPLAKNKHTVRLCPECNTINLHLYENGWCCAYCGTNAKPKDATSR